MIRGCLCERAISVDNVYYPDYTNVILDAYSNKSTWDYSNPYIDIWTPRFYRGPYAQAASDYSGYNCGLALCPRGDNPTTYGGIFATLLLYHRSFFSWFTIILCLILCFTLCFTLCFDGCYLMIFDMFVILVLWLP